MNGKAIYCRNFSSQQSSYIQILKDKCCFFSSKRGNSIQRSTTKQTKGFKTKNPSYNYCHERAMTRCYFFYFFLNSTLQRNLTQIQKKNYFGFKFSEGLYTCLAFGWRFCNWPLPITATRNDGRK
jgi:hypothetical protein